MATATYEICVDWNADDDFGDANEDITADVKSMSWIRGRDSELAKAVGGTCQLTLKNNTGKYTPSNSSSPLYGYLLPGRVVRIRTTSPATYNLWYGKIDRIVPHPHKTKQDAYIYCVDGFDFLNRAEISTGLNESQLTGTLVGDILDKAGWSATARSIDAGQDTVPLGYWQQVKALFAGQQLEQSELGFLYIDEQGNLVYEDRHHRLKSPHTVSQFTFDDTLANKKYPNITYDYGAKHIYNEIRTTVTPQTLGSTATIWTLVGETPLLAASETRIFWADFGLLAKNVITPVGSTDVIANNNSDGSGTDRTSDIGIACTAFAETAKITLTNNGSTSCYITTLQIRGDPYTTEKQTTAKADDSTSQTAYDKRVLVIDGSFLQNATAAQNLCDFSIVRYKDPQPEITLMVLGNIHADLLTQVLTRKLSDRITVKSADLDLNEDYFINKMDHKVTEAGKVHGVTYTLARCTDETGYWLLGTSTLGTNTYLAY